MDHKLLNETEATLNESRLFARVKDHEATVFGDVAHGKASAGEWVEAGLTTAGGVAVAAALAYSPSLASKVIAAVKARGAEGGNFERVATAEFQNGVLSDTLATLREPESEAGLIKGARTPFVSDHDLWLTNRGFAGRPLGGISGAPPDLDIIGLNRKSGFGTLESPVGQLSRPTGERTLGSLTDH